MLKHATVQKKNGGIGILRKKAVNPKTKAWIFRWKGYSVFAMSEGTARKLLLLHS